MYFEDFIKGQCIKTRSRTITSTDIDLFAAITGAVNPLFLHDEFAKKQGLKGRIAPGALTFSLLLYSVGALDQAIAFMGIEKLKFLELVCPNDILTANVEVIDKRETKKEDRGIVIFNSILINQKNRKY